MQRREIVKAFALSAGVLIVLVALSTQVFAAQDVKVVLKEWTMELSRTSIDIGSPVRFLVTNSATSKMPHSFRIEGQGLEATTLAIAPGKSATLEVTLPRAGQYRIYCPIPGHKEHGLVGDVEAGTF